MGDFDGRGVATDLVAVPVQNGQRRRDGVRAAGEVTGVGVPGHEPQGATGAGAADEDGHALLQRARVAHRLGHL